MGLIRFLDTSGHFVHLFHSKNIEGFSGSSGETVGARLGPIHAVLTRGRYSQAQRDAWVENPQSIVLSNSARPAVSTIKLNSISFYRGFRTAVVTNQDISVADAHRTDAINGFYELAGASNIIYVVADTNFPTFHHFASPEVQPVIRLKISKEAGQTLGHVESIISDSSTYVSNQGIWDESIGFSGFIIGRDVQIPKRAGSGPDQLRLVEIPQRFNFFSIDYTYRLKSASVGIRGHGLPDGTRQAMDLPGSASELGQKQTARINVNLGTYDRTGTSIDIKSSSSSKSINMAPESFLEQLRIKGTVGRSSPNEGFYTVEDNE